MLDWSSKFSCVILYNWQASLIVNATWIEVCEGSRTSDKQSFLIAIKF